MARTHRLFVDHRRILPRRAAIAILALMVAGLLIAGGHGPQMHGMHR